MRNMVTFTDVGKEVNLSTTTIMRTFDLVSYSPRDFPTSLSIDEFKGNTNKENTNVSLPIRLTRQCWTSYQSAMKAI